MRDSTRLVRTLLACLLAAFCLAAPATAWKVHQEGHAAAAAAFAEQDVEAATPDSTRDCTHEKEDHGHLTSLSGGMLALIPEMDFEPVLLEPAAIPAAAAVRSLSGSADPPLPRPPRFA